MSSARWQRVNELFHAALEHEGPARDAFLRDACGADTVLRAEVVSLLAADRTASAIPLEHLGAHVAADWARTAARTSLVGQRIDRYNVVAHLGGGGMGEVYRATDSVLGRDVALKVLTPALHGDAGFRSRLEQEARAASSLNHPNIVTVYEIGQAGAIDFVASELIDGVTLRERLAAGPLSLREIVDVVGQVTAALSSAHAGGLVHRDIKPENVMIRRDGLLKLLDFGVAKRSSPSLATGPHARVETQHGVVAGTTSYMSPEQALGEPVDHRSDLFSVGILLYELATGRRPFDGTSDAAIYYALLHRIPAPPSTLRRDLSADLDLVVGRALEKEADLRYQSAADLGADLKRLQRVSTAAAPAASRGTAPRTARAWQLAAIAAAVVAALLAAALVLERPAGDALPTRFTVGPPENDVFLLFGRLQQAMSLAVSPDGRRVAFIAGEPGGRSRLWVQSIDALDARAIDGTDGASGPFWSPDGNSIGFFASSALKRLDLAGGATRTLAETRVARGGSWGRNGTILYGNGTAAIFSVPADGGESVPVTTLDAARGEKSHRYPEFLPDGRHFLYLAGSAEAATLMVGSLDEPATTRLFETQSRARYAAPGYLLFLAADGALMARPFDPRRLQITGDATQLATAVAISSTGDASFATGGTTLAYAQRTATTSELTWFDRSGVRSGTLGMPGEYLGVRLSPDGHRVAVTRREPRLDVTSISLIDLRQGIETPFASGDARAAVWSPDGSRLFFASSRNTLRYQLHQRPSSAGAGEAVVFESTDSVHPDDWSPDGRFIVYSTLPAANTDLMLLRTADNRVTPLVASRFAESNGRISPDGRWLAYTSDETGRREIHVRPFPQGTVSVVVSLGGGDDAVWRHDGKELFYVAPNGALMSVTLSATDVIEASRPVELFRTSIPGDRRGQTSAYAVSHDGRRFLVPDAVGDPARSAITMLLNWPATLRR